MGTFVRGEHDEASENAAAGAEPTEEVGPGASEAKAEQCELSPEEIRGEQAGAAEFSMRSEIDEAFAPQTEVMVAHPDDGMPVPANESDTIAIAPAFTRENVVCIEDTRVFVEVFDEERSEHERLAAHGVHPMVDDRLNSKLSCRSKYDDAGKEVERTKFEPARVVERWGSTVVELSSDDARQAGQVKQMYVLVRPIRERCCFYMRQLFANDSQPNPKEPGHRLLFQNCTARRSVGGAYMAISNEAVYACDYRLPADPGTVTRELDEPAQKKLRERPHEVHLPLLGVA
jgi:hypothetical protein